MALLSPSFLLKTTRICIENMLKDGEIGEWEYIDLLKRYIARREKSMKEGN